MKRRKPKAVRRAPQADKEPSPQAQLALTLEAWFAARDLTLTDDDTAEVYDLTLELVQTMLGSFAAGQRLDEAVAAELAGAITDMRNAPDRL
ncbi:hypothetical protein [Streptomyces sp. t39]|uniref:hypothetical protein n=1 Tax=Streptomyces sp. t39 TaxID=1828156 RepID=UPI0011CD9031|nr:hypothetical protein [Streptomyces sp. t39]TXS39660.1 hypothetical protein EAO77_36255 [Streptomyces sp. t39]